MNITYIITLTELFLVCLYSFTAMSQETSENKTVFTGVKTSSLTSISPVNMKRNINTVNDSENFKYAFNQQLNNVLPYSKWKGNTVDRRGRFTDLQYPLLLNWKDIIKWQIHKNPQKKEKKKDLWKLEISKDSSWLQSKEDCIVWLGHNTFYIRINNIAILTDPIFGNLSHAYKRKTKFPITLISLLKKIDYVLISHDHRDHCDKKSLKTISKSVPNVQYMGGLGMSDLFNRINASNQNQTAGWYQQYQTDTSEIEIFFLPARHWARRGIFDTNKRLWGSFIIKSKNVVVYFSGDTGYSSYFKETATIFPEIDFAIIPIGVYQPEWFLSPFHISPQNAIKAFNEMGARKFIPAHYGTFDLTDETLHDPLDTIKSINMNNGIKGTLITPIIGETVYLNE